LVLVTSPLDTQHLVDQILVIWRQVDNVSKWNHVSTSALLCQWASTMKITLPMQSVPITTDVVSSNPAQTRCTLYNIMWRCKLESSSGEVYSIQHYVIKFISKLRLVCGFLWFPPPIKLTATILLKYCWKWR
jgi:hypothetical protein